MSDDEGQMPGPRSYHTAFDELIAKIVCWHGDFREPRANLECEAAIELKELVAKGIAEGKIGPAGLKKDIQEYINKKATQRAAEYVKKYNVTPQSEAQWFAAKIMDRHRCAMAIFDFLFAKPSNPRPRLPRLPRR